MSNSERFVLLRNISEADGEFGTLTKKKWTSKAELHAISTALERTVSIPDITNARI